MKIRYFWKPGLWLLVIFYLSLMPGEDIPRIPLFSFPHFDKVVHLVMYFVFALLLIKPFSTLSKRAYLYSFLLAMTISGCIEIMQATLTKLRHGDWFDFLANLTGIALAILLHHFLISGEKWEKYF